MHCLVQKIRCIHLFKDETGFQILWMEGDSDGSWVRVTAQRQGRWSLASDGESRGKCGQLPKLRLIVLMSASALCVLPGARPILSTKSRVSLVIKVRLGAQAELRAGWGHTHSRLSSEHTQTKHQPSDLFTKQIPPPRSGIPLLLPLMKYCRLVLSVEPRSPLWPQTAKTGQMVQHVSISAISCHQNVLQTLIACKDMDTHDQTSGNHLYQTNYKAQSSTMDV